jgi:hypothetical protein
MTQLFYDTDDAREIDLPERMPTEFAQTSGATPA